MVVSRRLRIDWARPGRKVNTKEEFNERFNIGFCFFFFVKIMTHFSARLDVCKYVDFYFSDYWVYVQTVTHYFA